jgi:hypothetical protein
MVLMAASLVRSVQRLATWRCCPYLVGVSMIWCGAVSADAGVTL